MSPNSMNELQRMTQIENVLEFDEADFQHLVLDSRITDPNSFESMRRFLTSTARQGKFQAALDKLQPHVTYRWIFFAFCFLYLLIFRVWSRRAHFVVAYAVCIYVLNLFIGFLTPAIDPDEERYPERKEWRDEGFKPFVRLVPEFKLWDYATRATLLGLFCTLFNVLDPPVFWPLLLVYFILLFCCTMRQRIEHMVQYGYLPFTTGKKVYGKHREGGGSTIGAIAEFDTDW